MWLASLSGLGALLMFISLSSCNDDPSCFQVTSSNCSESLKNGNKCTKVSTATSTGLIYCCNITSEREIQEYISKFKTNSRSILGFHLRDSNFSRLNINVFNDLPDLVSLSITENGITKIEGNFERHKALSCFNISRNKELNEIPPQITAKLGSLKSFDMSNIQVPLVPEFPLSQNIFFRLDVSGNKFLECKYLINLTLKVLENNYSLSYDNKNTTICLPPNGELAPYKTLVHVKMENIEKVDVIFSDCPVINGKDKCNCSIYSLDYAGDSNKNMPYMYQALVNCSNKQMTTLPKVLPPNTRVLDISNNSITSFEGIGNETYSTVREVYADNNKITSLKHLEGTSFLDNFSKLSLRNNKIDQIQEYLLSNVFDRSNMGTFLFLAKNELKCDCHAASSTKVWLIANKAHIPDYDQIFATCETPTKILELDSKDLCRKPTNWKDYIRYFIVVEITLFVLLIGKVSYDYYVFKTAGYLPWPASKMPKLPCDWCFET